MEKRESILENRIGYVTSTYKVRLYDRHKNWIFYTKQLYNQVVWHYYQILVSEVQILEQSNFLALRRLEELSVGTKEMKAKGEEPVWKLENLPKIPLYFRRSAINMALGLARSYMASKERRQEEKKEFLPSIITSLDCSIVLYKGMYRNFSKNSIELKLYNGEKWVWVTYPYTGREIPKEGRMLSPTLKVEKYATFLHIPVEIKVYDIRTVNERMEKEKKICAVSFPDNDCLAVCVLMDRDGIVKESYFIRGGAEREKKRQKQVVRLEKSKESRKSDVRKRDSEKGKTEDSREKQNIGRENQKIYKKIQQINQYYAHQVSREIVAYCVKNEIKVIVVPNYESTIDFHTRRYLSADKFHWQGRSIIRNLKYKAFQKGIVVTAIRPYHIADSCSECGEKIQRYNQGHKASRNYYGGRLYHCPNGHKGNSAFNTAKNIGRYFLKRFSNE